MQIPRRERSCHGKLSARLVRSEHILSGLCFPRRMWWARAGSTGVTLWTSHININGTRAKGWSSWPTHSSCSSCPNRVKPFILGFTDKLGLGLHQERTKAESMRCAVWLAGAIPGGIWKGGPEEVTNHSHFSLLKVPWSSSARTRNNSTLQGRCSYVHSWPPTTCTRDDGKSGNFLLSVLCRKTYCGLFS